MKYTMVCKYWKWGRCYGKYQRNIWVSGSDILWIIYRRLDNYYQPEPIFEQSFEKEYSKIDEELKKIKALSRELNERLIELRNIIRIYLKIE